MYIKNKKWFLLVEIVIAAWLLVLFLFWVYKFFNIQNKNIDSLIKEYNANNLAEDAVFIFSNTDYNSLTEWLYGMYFEDYENWTSNYNITQITSNNTSYEDGKFLDEKWYVTSYLNSEENRTTYKIAIQVFWENEIFAWQKFKNITVSVRYPWCSFESLACVVKDFTVLENSNYE